MKKFKFENHVSAKLNLNGELEVEIAQNDDWDELSREANIAVYDKDKKLVINAVTDIDMLIFKLQRVREELF